LFVTVYTYLLYFKTGSKGNNKKKMEEGTIEDEEGDKWKKGTEKERRQMRPKKGNRSV
jgi:hypothetical protein